MAWILTTACLRERANWIWILSAAIRRDFRLLGLVLAFLERGGANDISISVKMGGHVDVQVNLLSQFANGLWRSDDTFGFDFRLGINSGTLAVKNTDYTLELVGAPAGVQLKTINDEDQRVIQQSLRFTSHAPKSVTLRITAIDNSATGPNLKNFELRPISLGGRRYVLDKTNDKAGLLQINIVDDESSIPSATVAWVFPNTAALELSGEAEPVFILSEALSVPVQITVAVDPDDPGTATLSKD